jgi:hypothetical protein
VSTQRAGSAGELAWCRKKRGHMSYFNMKNTKNRPALFVLSFFLMTYQANTGFAGKKENEISKLQNPISVQYIKEHLRKLKPRMVFNDKIVEDLRGKIKTDPVIGNLYRAIRLKAQGILELPLMSRVKTSNAMLDISREMLRRVNMLGNSWQPAGSRIGILPSIWMWPKYAWPLPWLWTGPATSFPKQHDELPKTL